MHINYSCVKMYYTLDDDSADDGSNDVDKELRSSVAEAIMRGDSGRRMGCRQRKLRDRNVEQRGDIAHLT